MAKKEGVDYGFIDIKQIDPRGEVHTSSLEWMKGSPRVRAVGNIPHGNEILFTVEALKTLYEKLLTYNEEED